MPEYPEVEALREVLEESVTGREVARAGPAHVATLKTVDPPLAALEGSVFASPRRRGKHLLLATTDDGLILHIHQMSAGRISVLAPDAAGPKCPAFSLTFTDGGRIVLTERGSKKRARVGLYMPDALAAELGHLGPEAHEVDDEILARALSAESRRLHSFLRDQRALAGIGRAWANEILNRSRLSPYALTTELGSDAIEQLGNAIRERLAEGLRSRCAGRTDKQVYSVHNRLGEPCPNCATALAQIDFEEHTIFYCPTCQTNGRLLKDRRMSRLLR